MNIVKPLHGVHGQAVQRWLARLAALVAIVAGSHASPAAAQSSQWQPIGPDYGTVITMAHQPGNDAVALAGTYFGGLYRSTDWGYTWKAVDSGFAAGTVFSLGFDPRTPGRVYAGLFQDGVWRSDDGGLTWARRSTGLLNPTVQAVAVDPSSSQRVLAATPDNVFLSSDAGANWSAVPAFAGLAGRSIAFDPARPGTIAVGTVGSGVYRSSNGGASWTAVNTGLPSLTISSLGFDAAGHLYAATSTGVAQLPQGGTSWTDLSFNLPRIPVAHVYVHPTAPNVLFAASASGVYVISNWASTPTWYRLYGDGARFVTSDSRGTLLHAAGEIGWMKLTTDFGTTWTRGDYGIQAAFIGGMATIASSSGRRLLAGTDLGVMGLDAGAAWKNPLPLREGVFEIHTRDSIAYAGMETSGVWKSVDQGDHWVPASNGIVPTRVASLDFTSEATPTLLAATASGAYRSTDGGAHWSAIRLAQVSFVHTIAADPVRPPIVYLGTGGGEVYRSIDSGQNFSFAGGGLPKEDIIQLVHAPWAGVYAITATGKLYDTVDNGFSWYPAQTGCDSPAAAVAVEPQRNWVVYLATSGGGICKSVSGGQQWTRINNGITNLYVGSLWIDPRNPQQLWAGSVGRVYRSTDGGSNWQAFTTGLPAGIVTSLTGHPTDSSRLFAVVYGFGLYETRDGGSTWALRSGSDVATGALALRVDPSQPNRLLVGTPHRGVQASVDDGASWQALNTGMSLFVRSIASDPGAASTLYAATLGGGLFRSQDSAANWTNIGLAAGNVFRVRSPAPNLLLVGTTDGISITRDAGATWGALGQRTSFLHSMVADPLDSRRVIVGGAAGQAWMPDASGTSWKDVGAGLPAADVLDMTRCSDNTVYAAVEGSGVWRTSMSAPGTWENAGSAGLGTARVNHLACDPRSGFLYAGSNGSGLFLSMNGGANWTAINKGVVGNVISAVVTSPITAWQVWAAVQDGTVYRSDDAGLNWIATNTNLPQGDISYLVAAIDGTLYAAAGTAVYRRPASGGNWTPAALGLPGVRLTVLWADPSRSGVLLAGVAGRGLFITTNGGASWTAAATDAASADATVIAGGLTRIHVGTLGTGVTWSDNGGTQFGPVQAPDQIPQIVTDIAVDAVNQNTIYLATGGQGVILSRDGGAHWRASNTGLSNLSLLCVVAHPLRSGELYAGTHAGVFVSRDGGASWTALNLGLTNRNVSSLTFDKQIPDILYVGLEGGGIFYYDTRR